MGRAAAGRAATGPGRAATGPGRAWTWETSSAPAAGGCGSPIATVTPLSFPRIAQLARLTLSRLTLARLPPPSIAQHTHTHSSLPLLLVEGLTRSWVPHDYNGRAAYLETLRRVKDSHRQAPPLPSFEDSLNALRRARPKAGQLKNFYPPGWPPFLSPSPFSLWTTRFPDGGHPPKCGCLSEEEEEEGGEEGEEWEGAMDYTESGGEDSDEDDGPPPPPAHAPALPFYA